MPAHALRARLGAIEPAGRLERALRRGAPGRPLRLVCEVKRASPSKGMLQADVDPVAQASLYAAGGAAAVSLVTEPDHFRGDPAWVDAVRPAVKLPLLMKDFVVDPYQILDAAARGADAVLLLAALLSETELQRFITEARLVGLDCLVEVHDADELRGAVRAGRDRGGHQQPRPAHLRGAPRDRARAPAAGAADGHRGGRERDLPAPPTSRVCARPAATRR